MGKQLSTNERLAKIMVKCGYFDPGRAFQVATRHIKGLL